MLLLQQEFLRRRIIPSQRSAVYVRFCFLSSLLSFSPLRCIVCCTRCCSRHHRAQRRSARRKYKCTACVRTELLFSLCCVCECSEIVWRPCRYVCCIRSLVFRPSSESVTSLTLTCACENPLRSAMSTRDVHHWYIHAYSRIASSILWVSIHCYLRYLFVLHGDESMQIASRADRGGVWQTDVFFLA
jgi:hypothetical protein